MQHDLSKVSTLRRTERLRTPDRSDIRNMDTSTMSVSSPKRGVHTSRISMMPPSSLNTSSINLRKLELEHNNLELELTYSQYIASYAELILEQKSLKEEQDSFGNSLKKAHKETKSLLENEKLIETRINDGKALSHINDFVDNVQAVINHFKEKEQKYKIHDILKQLRQLLDRFSILRCENIILPSSPEELEEFKKTLTNCCTLLTEINRVFKCNELENVATAYREFLTMCKEVSSVKKMVEEKLCELQIENLKACSDVLSITEEDSLTD